jgi:hypothetical protein
MGDSLQSVNQLYSKRQEAKGRRQKVKSLLSGRFILSLCPNLSLACYSHSGCATLTVEMTVYQQ